MLQMPTEWRLEGGVVLTDQGLAPGRLTVRDGRIADIAQPDRGVAASDLPVVDAFGLLVLPGIIDIHGDGFERQIMPRPGVCFDIAMALKETDRQLIANGITTAFHGVTVSWEPGLRSLEAARDIVMALRRLRPALTCDTRLHIRWETFAFDAMEEVLAWIRDDPETILAFNDHTTGPMLKQGTIARKIGQWAERAGLSREAYIALLEQAWARRSEVQTNIEWMAAQALSAGAILLAHDEKTVQERERFRSMGAVSSEFPMTLETARAARQAGEDVILGAPNVVRGGSHNGALDATEAVRAGLCTVLASDYHYPSPLHAAFKLATSGEDGMDLAEAWKLVSQNPARAAGLVDRGRLSDGARADFILVDAKDRAHPQVVATSVAGQWVFMARPIWLTRDGKRRDLMAAE